MPNNSNQLPNDSLFKNLNNIRTSSKHLDSLSFYKLLITLSNLHSTVSTFYESVNEKSLSSYHNQLAVRFATDANNIKNIKLNSDKNS